MRGWIERVVELFMASFDLGTVSAGDLIQLVKLVVFQFQQSRPGLFPSLHELRNAVTKFKQNLKFRDQVIITYLTRIEDRINSLLSSSLGEAFSVYDGLLGGSNI
jgi:hypothetical protein